MRHATRREFLEHAILAGSVGWVGQALTRAPARAQSPPARGDLLEVVPFTGESRLAVGEVTGVSHAGRLALDLSRLTTERLITPTDEFFIRTRFPDRLRLSRTADWSIAVGGLVRAPTRFSLATLADLVESQGTHLFECSGNGRRRAFGLLSAATWSGVPLARLFERTPSLSSASHVLVGGFDEHSNASDQGSGASWIFSFDQLIDAGAFLATHMNDQPLPLDHGFPVRLLVPGWYGCTMAKWVDRIEFVGADRPPTPQMREYARRTHQRGVPDRAADFLPARIDQTGMPIRVEQWRTGQGLRYRVVGLLWGGDRSTADARIRFNADEPFVPLDHYDHATNRTWTLWTHDWSPSRPGSYRIELSIDDANIRTRRLDSGYYARTVELLEV